MYENIKKISFCIDYFEELTPKQIRDYFALVEKMFKTNTNVHNIKKYVSKSNKKTYFNIHLKKPIDTYEEFEVFYAKDLNIALSIPRLKIFYTEGIWDKTKNIKPDNKFAYQQVLSEHHQFLNDDDDDDEITLFC